MSSKFKPPATKANYPSWCKKGPDFQPIMIIDGWPTTLQAYANWTDLDPLKPVSLSEAFQLEAITPGLHYYGQSAATGTRLEIQAIRYPDSNTWTADIWVWDQWRTGEDFSWLKHPPQVQPPLKIIFPDDVVIPNFDFRRLSLYG